MVNEKSDLNTLQEIKQMMERSSRFISLSGWSGIAAGICALIGAAFAFCIMGTGNLLDFNRAATYTEQKPAPVTVNALLESQLFTIALLTLVAAFLSSLLFTYLKSKKNNTLLWGSAAKRLLINVSIPMLAGGIFLLKLIEAGNYGLIAPGCLIFYGLALVNGSKYTIGEVRFLGIGQLFLGIVNCYFIGYGLYFWTMGFGVLHIIYGALMWYKYESVVD